MITNSKKKTYILIQAAISLSICLLLVCAVGCDSDESSDSTTAASKDYKPLEPELKSVTTDNKVEVVDTVVEKVPEKSDELQDQNKLGYVMGVVSARKVRQVLDNIPGLPEGWSRFSNMDSAHASEAILNSTGLSPEHPPIPASDGKAMKDGMTEEMVIGFGEGFGDYWDGQTIKYEFAAVQAEILKKYDGNKPDWLKK